MTADYANEKKNYTFCLAPSSFEKEIFRVKIVFFNFLKLVKILFMTILLIVSYEFLDFPI